MRPESIVVAKWWRDQLNSETFDNGDDSPMGLTVKSVVNIATKNRPVISMDQADTFEQSIASDVDIMLDQHGGYCQSVGVDYDPDRVLSKALKAASIDAFMTLPWKTVTSFKVGLVEVAIGYGKPFKQIYP